MKTQSIQILKTASEDSMCITKIVNVNVHLLIETDRKSAIFFLPWRLQIKTEEMSENGDTVNPQVNKNWVILDTI